MNLYNIIIVFVLSLCGLVAHSQTAIVEGNILTPQGNGISNVMVQTTLGGYNTTTDANGHYSLELPISEDYTIQFTKDDDYKENVTFRDLINIYRIILGMSSFPEQGDWQGIAADVNSDGIISTFDIVLIQKLLTLDEDPNSDSWYIYDGTNTEIQIDNLQADMTDLNMIGIKRGDMDCN